MTPSSSDDTSSLERARRRLYQPMEPTAERRPLTAPTGDRLERVWEDRPLDQVLAKRETVTTLRGARPVRVAGIFFAGASAFFLIAVAVSFGIFFIGGNTISVDKVTVAIQGPTTIAGGDTVPLSITIANTNAVAVQDAKLEIEFPKGTRSATDILKPYLRYSEDIGSLASGARVTRSVQAVLFGGAGETLTLPVSLSYSASGSNAKFVKKATYTTDISTTPLSVSVDTETEAVSGQPLTLRLTVRSNANVPLDNVVLTGAFPFGFVVQSSSIPLNNSSFLLGTLAPSASKSVTLVGIVTGQEKEQRIFHFTVGTAKSPQDQTLAVTYMTQDARVTIAAPFIATTLSLNGVTSGDVLTPGVNQSVNLSYTNTLSTSVTNATISITLSGGAVDYSSIKTSNGFYRSTDHTIVFSRDTDPGLAVLAPGATGVGTFSFATLPAKSLTAAPNITLTTSVSGTRVGQSNVPEEVTAFASKTVKVASTVAFSAATLHNSGPLSASGPIPPSVGKATTYTIQWNARTLGTAVAGGVIRATLPNYVTYTGVTTNNSAFSYDAGSHTVTWTVGDLAAGASATGAFQVALTPSSSQKGAVPKLTNAATFSGYDRFAGVPLTSTAEALTTETPTDTGYIPANGVVQ